jgi:polysaccharide biosynthesis/export protein
VSNFVSRILAAFVAMGMSMVTPAIAQDNAATQAADPAGEAQSTLSECYVLGAGDVVEVAVLGREDYRARVQIQVDGTVQLPLINDIPAANRTVLQLRSDVRTALINGGYFTSPAISVAVASYASRYVTVLGEVAMPGLVPIDRSYRVSEILARVGGHRATAADVLTLSRADGAKVELDIAQIATGSGDADPVVNPGDRIFIAPAAQFFIYGQVNAPGSYRVDRKMTIRMALARGGGLTAQGSERRVKVIRDGVELKSFDPNGLVLPGDTIVVGERFF